jgi:hypothetical protein
MTGAQKSDVKRSDVCLLSFTFYLLFSAYSVIANVISGLYTYRGCRS